MLRFPRSSFVCRSARRTIAMRCFTAPEIAILSVLSLGCQQPTATPPLVATAPPASNTATQPREAEELRLKAAYPGLQTLSEAFPKGSFTIDAQDAATRGTLLLASVTGHLERGYDLERTADGRISLSFFAAVETDDRIYSDEERIGPSYIVQLQCSEEQANALRKRPSQLPLSRAIRFPLRVIFRLSSASRRPILALPSDDRRPPGRVLQGTLVAFSPSSGVPD
jgi:hypothetical protein